MISDRLRLSRAAQEAPNNVALVVGGQELSFAELWRRTEPLIAQLTQLTAAPPAPIIALTAEPRLDELLILYACLELNRPLLLLHPRWQQAERERVTQQLKDVALYEGGGCHRQRSDSGASPEPEDQVLLATSGTTGTPKIVPLSQGNLIAAAESHALNLPFVSDDRWLLALPFAHVGGLSILIRCLWARSTVVVARASNEGFLEQLESERVSLLSVVPTQLRKLIEGRALPRNIRAVLVGGAKAKASLRAQAASRGIPAIYTYGMTEAASQVCSQSLNSSEDGSTDSVGRPLAGLELRTTAAGRIELRGPQIFRGYLGEAAPRGPQDWFATSDCGQVRADGSVVLLGRIDDLIISGGENVSPDTVEQALIESGVIQEACVVGVGHPRWGQMVTALVVPLPDQLNWREKCQSHLKLHLADYARPKHLLAVESFPLLPSGKPDRRQMLDFAELMLQDPR